MESVTDRRRVDWSHVLAVCCGGEQPNLGFCAGRSAGCCLAGLSGGAAAPAARAIALVRTPASQDPANNSANND